MGLSAWKQAGASRWPLRVNPYSGNLHPTETYLVWDGGVYHYAVDTHALEARTVKVGDPLRLAQSSVLVGLTSIYWREAWKYGERAFRYCQHDTGHAIGALRLSAAMLGWRLTLLPRWTDADIAALLGVDRDADFAGAEREDPECLAIVTAGDPGLFLDADPAPWVAAARSALWHGTANRLSPDHVDWPLIDAVAAATSYSSNQSARSGADLHGSPTDGGAHGGAAHHAGPARHHGENPVAARQIVLRRRSALAFNPGAALRRDAFFAMLERLQPGAPPWDALDSRPLVHLAIFVHRVEGLVPGIYAYLRDTALLPGWKAAMRPEFLWEQIDEGDLFLLLPIDCRNLARRVSCDQDIAADGFFSLGMIANFEAPLRQQGEWMYRRLFWECGLIGQVLYLEAEAAGARATGIGCFYDDAVHETLGLTGPSWQSLYHFSMGQPIEDTRLKTEPGYPWEETTTSTSNTNSQESA